VHVLLHQTTWGNKKKKRKKYYKVMTNKFRWQETLVHIQQEPQCHLCID